jgi:glycosyltransferase involved in cell wall biosynthesis
MSLTVAILALNEEEMIANAIASAAFADEILVLDGGSTDATTDIASRAGARVVVRPFDDFARQRNHALEIASGDWVLFVDADERITPDLAEGVRERLKDPGEADAFPVPRNSIALGKALTWHPGGPDQPIRLMRRTASTWVGAVHETAEVVKVGAPVRGHLVHLTHRSVSALVQKIDQYSEYEAERLASTGARPPSIRQILYSTPKAIWSLWRSGLKREGIEGAIEAFLLAFNRTLVLAKVWERTRAEPLDQTYRRIDRELMQGDDHADGAAPPTHG